MPHTRDILVIKSFTLILSSPSFFIVCQYLISSPHYFSHRPPIFLHYFSTDKPLSQVYTMFLHSQPMLATASLSGVLGVWDLSSYRLRQQCKHPVSTLKCVMYQYVSLREYSHISINDQLSTTANVFFFWQTVHTFTVGSTSIQKPLSYVPKVVVVERFNCNTTTGHQMARIPICSV